MRNRPLFSSRDLQAGCGLPPLTKERSAKAEYLDIFGASSAELEALAISHHRALQSSILAAMEEDAGMARYATEDRPRSLSVP